MEVLAAGRLELDDLALARGDQIPDSLTDQLRLVGGIHVRALVAVGAAVDRLAHRGLDQPQQTLEALVEEPRELVLAQSDRINLVRAQDRVELRGVDLRLRLDRRDVLTRGGTPIHLLVYASIGVLFTTLLAYPSGIVFFVHQLWGKM